MRRSLWSAGAGLPLSREREGILCKSGSGDGASRARFAQCWRALLGDSGARALRPARGNICAYPRSRARSCRPHRRKARTRTGNSLHAHAHADFDQEKTTYRARTQGEQKREATQGMLVPNTTQYPLDKFVFSRCAPGFFLLFGEFGLLEVFCMPSRVFAFFGETLPNDVRDSQRKYDPREKDHFSDTILTPTPKTSSPAEATAAATVQSSAVPRPARNNVSSGAKTNNRIPMSRRASAQSSCRCFVTIIVCSAKEIPCPVRPLGVTGATPICGSTGSRGRRAASPVRRGVCRIFARWAEGARRARLPGRGARRLARRRRAG